MDDFTARRITMVDTQVRPHDVTKFPVINAMLATPREAFVPADARGLAYVDGPVTLSGERVLLDARSIGKMLDALEVTPKDLVLEIGAGMGYTTALLAHMAEAVVAVEEDADLASEAEAALSAQQVDNAMIVQAPLVAGSPKHGPFDAIVIFGGVSQIPQSVVDQLKENGRIMAIFMKGALGEARLGRKIDGRVSWRMDFNATAPVLPGFAAAPAFEF